MADVILDPETAALCRAVSGGRIKLRNDILSVCESATEELLDVLMDDSRSLDPVELLGACRLISKSVKAFLVAA